MLRVRPVHILVALLLHAGIYLLWVQGPLTTQEPITHPENDAHQALPQRLVTVPPSPAQDPDPAADDAQSTASLRYAGDTPPPAPPASEPPEPVPEQEGSVSQAEEDSNSPPPPVPPQLDAPLTQQAPPALGQPSTTGVRAPRYTVHGLSDALVREMVSAGQAQTVVRARTEFYVAATPDNRLAFRHITALPAGYAGRGLPLSTPFSQAIQRALRREYGYAAADIVVLLLPSVALDREILAEQEAVAQQLEIDLEEVQETTGRLVRQGDTVVFRIEQVRLKNGHTLHLE